MLYATRAASIMLRNLLIMLLSISLIILLMMLALCYMHTGTDLGFSERGLNTVVDL